MVQFCNIDPDIVCLHVRFCKLLSQSIFSFFAKRHPSRPNSSRNWLSITNWRSVSSIIGFCLQYLHSPFRAWPTCLWRRWFIKPCPLWLTISLRTSPFFVDAITEVKFLNVDFALKCRSCTVLHASGEHLPSKSYLDWQVNFVSVGNEQRWCRIPHFLVSGASWRWSQDLY